ncbi:MAG: ATP-binding protein [Patescibacteria group bacterium]
MAHLTLNIDKVSGCKGKKGTKDAQENGCIKRKVAGETRTKSAHEMRRVLGEKVETLDFLNQDQQEEVKLVVGEVLTNAFCYSPEQSDVEVVWVGTDSKLLLVITNSNGKCAMKETSLPEDCMAEHGRGRFIVDSLVKELDSNDKICANCSYGHHRGRTIFQMAIGC